MPWEITIKHQNHDNTPLGELEEIRRWVADTLPGADLEMPPLPPQEEFDRMMPSVQKLFLEPRLEALYLGDGFTIEFFIYLNHTPLRWINADVRGSGNPIPDLARLCLPKHWMVIDAAEKSRGRPGLVDLTAGVSHLWQGFNGYRDYAVKISQSPSPAGPGPIQDQSNSLEGV